MLELINQDFLYNQQLRFLPGVFIGLQITTGPNRIADPVLRQESGSHRRVKTCSFYFLVTSLLQTMDQRSTMNDAPQLNCKVWGALPRTKPSQSRSAFNNNKSISSWDYLPVHMHMWRKHELWGHKYLIGNPKSMIHWARVTLGKQLTFFMCKSGKAVSYFFRVMLQWFNNTQHLVGIQQMSESLPSLPPTSPPHSISPRQFNVLNLGSYIKPNLMILICCEVTAEPG